MGQRTMTRPTAGGTRHGWLVDDLAAIVSEVKNTAGAILRSLTRYQEAREEAHLTAAALHSAELFQEIGRMTAVLAEMRLLLESAKPKSAQADIERLEQEVANLRVLVEQMLDSEVRGD